MSDKITGESRRAVVSSEQEVPFSEIRKGQVFRIYEGDGKVVKGADGEVWYRATANSEVFEGYFRVECDPLKTRPQAASKMVFMKKVK